MKILIVGSKGFIGSYLCAYFKQRGDRIIECDVVVDYNNKDYYQVDASNSDYREVIESNSFDICVNCSGAASVQDSFVHNFRDFTLNVSNLYKLLNSIKEIQPALKFINLSSAAVYGNPIKLPITESTYINPISPYGLHKKQAEEICHEFYKFYNIPTISLRIFSAYGEGLKKQLFWDLFQKSQHSKKIDLYGTGNETRDFIHVHDIARAMVFIIDNYPFLGRSINVANGIEIKIKEACKTFFDFADFDGEYQFMGTNRKGDPANWRADISELARAGYQSTIDIREGLNRYVKWTKSLQ